MTLLQLEQLHVSYRQKPVLHNISLSIERGDIVVIVGESGSGKTTLLKTIGHFLSSDAQVDATSFSFNGQSMLQASEKQWQRVLGRDIAVIFQNPLSFFSPVKKIKHHIIRCVQNHQKLSKEIIVGRAISTLETMNFTHDEATRILQAYPFQLSGGMLQRVSIALAMLLQPALLLADEPTSALDVLTQKQVLEELLLMRRTTNAAILMITHDMSAALYVADRIVVIQNGQIVEQGTTDQILRSAQHPYTQQLLQSAKESAYARA